MKNCNLDLIETKGNDGKIYENLVITTPNGTSFKVRYAFYNRKLAYKVKCEIKASK